MLILPELLPPQAGLDPASAQYARNPERVDVY